MLAAAFTLSVLPAFSALAEELTDEEMLAIFNKQRDAYKTATEGGGLTRGLTLVPLDQVETTVVTGELGTPPEDEESGIGLSGSTGGVKITSTEGLQPLEPDAPANADTADAPKVTTVATEAIGTFADEDMRVDLEIKFGFDSAALGEDQKPRLAQVCRVMKASDIGVFRIAGHTDGSGSAEYNMKLSQLRAEEVQRFLVNDCGIAPQRLQAVGLGEEFLVNSKDPKAPENRRVEFQALS